MVTAEANEPQAGRRRDNAVGSVKRCSVLNYLTHHFSHQVDEVLTGRFPDILLLWIGRNDVDWRSQLASPTHESLLELSNAFVQRYEVQIRRLLNDGLESDNRTAIVIFGLINFGSFHAYPVNPYTHYM